MNHDADHDDAERLRQRQAEADDAATRTPPSSGRGAACVVAQVASGATGAGPRVSQMNAQVVTGTEAEGDDGVLTDAGWTFYATNIGNTAPDAGTNVLCTFCDFRWCFQYDG